jgi:endonuclease G
MREFKTGWVARCAAVAALFAMGCASAASPAQAVRRASRPAPFSTYRVPQAGLTEQQRTWLALHCPGGEPRTTPEWTNGPTTRLVRAGYALAHSPVDRIAYWVCEHVGAPQLAGNLPRPGTAAFRPDPELPAGRRAELSDYRGSGYDRGHQAPNGDQAVDAELQLETFYLSNMTPQAPLLNQGIWATLEDQVRQWVRGGRAVQIITGPMFYDPQEENPATADGQVDFSRIGDNGVAVPTHYFKIVVREGVGGRREAIAFVFENRTYERPYHLEGQIQSIDWIEQRTGLDFLSELPESEQQTLESTPTAMWR